jgi:membrane-associated phospholipid phosphatase
LSAVAALFLAIVSSAQTSLAQQEPPEPQAEPSTPQPPPAPLLDPPLDPPLPPEPSLPSDPPPPSSTATPRVQLRSNLAVDLTVTGVLAASLIAWGVAIKPNLRAPSCTICDGSNGKVNAIDDAFRTTFKHGSSEPAGLVSDIFAYGLAPATGIGLAIAVPMHDGRGNEAPENILLIVEASLAFAVMQQGLTALVPRERPYVHAQPSPEHESSLQRHSALESFPAGHNGSAFAIAAAGGTVATMRGYRLAPLVWIAGGAIAFVTTYLRMAADRHYFTDLTVGAALGIGTGIAIPLLFHRPVGERPSAATRWLQGAMVSTTDVPGGRIVGIGWGF